MSEEVQIVKAVLRNVRVSPRKLNLQAQLIRGKTAAKALEILAFARQRVSNDVHKTLYSAVSNAENNHGLDVDRLVVHEAHVGQSFSMRRHSPRAKGRAGAIKKYFSHLTITVRESEV
ncbi:MAG: 50S ribosomal protein L22 [Alphaproteobacteria bacterium]